MGESLIVLLPVKYRYFYIGTVVLIALLFTDMAGEVPDGLRLNELFEEVLGQPATNMDVDDEEADEQVHNRLVAYLEKRRAASSNAAIPPPSNNNPADCGTYLAIKRIVIKRLEVPSLYGGANTTVDVIGSFRDCAANPVFLSATCLAKKKKRPVQL
jgi:hypothetical protein